MRDQLQTRSSCYSLLKDVDDYNVADMSLPEIQSLNILEDFYYGYTVKSTQYGWEHIFEEILNMDFRVEVEDEIDMFDTAPLVI